MLTFDNVITNRWAAEQHLRRRNAGQQASADGFLDAIMGPTLVSIAGAPTSQERTLWVDECLRNLHAASQAAPAVDEVGAAWYRTLYDWLVALGYGIADGVPPRCPCGCGQNTVWGAIRTPTAATLVRATELGLRADAWRATIAARQPTSLVVYDAAAEAIWELRAEVVAAFHGTAELDVSESATLPPARRVELADAWLSATVAMPGAPVKELRWDDAPGAVVTHALLRDTTTSDPGTFFG